MTNNLVEIIGFQYEFVHTGVIKWLLDTDKTYISMKLKYNILKRIYKYLDEEMDFEEKDLYKIKCIPEYSFGRQIKIDLVINIILYDRTKRYLVIEMKVDSIPTEKQLENMYEKFETEVGNSSKAYYLLFLFGTSQICRLPEETHNSNVILLNDIINIFDNLNIEDRIYQDWIISLKNEMKRKNDIYQHIKNIDDIWNDEYWNGLGYRTKFPLFYYIYNELRKYLSKNNTWNIYSGSNNPVMNWQEGWLKKTYLDKNYCFYWEFNYQKLLLKVKINKNQTSKDNLLNLRERVYKICNTINSKRGTTTQKRYGTYNSIYKWSFDFKNEEFREIAKETDNIINKIYPLLKRI